MRFPWGDSSIRPVNRIAKKSFLPKCLAINEPDPEYSLAKQPDPPLVSKVSSKKKCPHCGKNVKNLGDHFESKHPEYLKRYQKEHPLEYPKSGFKK